MVEAHRFLGVGVVASFMLFLACGSDNEDGDEGGGAATSGSAGTEGGSASGGNGRGGNSGASEGGSTGGIVGPTGGSPPPLGGGYPTGGIAGNGGGGANGGMGAVAGFGGNAGTGENGADGGGGVGAIGGRGGAGGGAPFPCGATTCQAAQYCVLPCCGTGGAPLCSPKPDGGVCPPNTTDEGTCCREMPCTPAPAYCSDRMPIFCTFINERTCSERCG